MRIMMPAARKLMLVEKAQFDRKVQTRQTMHGPVTTLDQMSEEKVWEMVRLYGPISQK